MTSPICVFGEVLFDHFPDGSRVLGGAPFNVAWNLQALGEDVQFISRVGEDAEGSQIRESMRDWGMDLRHLQSDSNLSTGRVSVSLAEGEPSYDIVAPCAYDRIQPIQEPPACSLVYHGTLALRDPASRAALDVLLGGEPKRVFVDVNLRPPWWDRHKVLAQLEHAHWVKLNTEELAQLSDQRMGDQHAARTFVTDHGLSGLVLTHGSEGAELFTSQGEHFAVSPSGDTQVLDTVGAGDAFASVMLLGLVRNWPLQLTLERAQAFASALVGQRGATVPDRHYYQQYTNTWN